MKRPVLALSATLAAAIAFAVPSQAMTFGHPSHALVRMEWVGTPCLTYTTPAVGNPTVVGSPYTYCSPQNNALSYWAEIDQNAAPGQLVGADPEMGDNSSISCELYINGHLDYAASASAGDSQQVNCLRRLN